jgi:hypothetical protein
MPRSQRIALPFCALALMGGCGIVQGAAETVFPGTQTTVPPPDQVLKDLLHFADQIVLRSNVALREFELQAGTPEAATQAAQWQLQILRLSTQHAASPNSFASLLDLSLLVTLAGWLQEDVWAGMWGDAVQPVRRALADLQKEGLRLLARNCDPKHLEEMRELLRRWREEHPKLTRASILELPSFTSLLEQSPAATSGSSSLLGIVGLDPLAALEPTAREIERSRELAERLLFFVERAPRLVSLEIEVRILQARQSDEVRQVFADMGRVTTSLESFAATAAGLPAAISAEREAALKQIDDTVTQQRAGLLHDIDTAQAPLGSVLEKTQAALTAGERMSAELTRALQALDAFVARVSGPAEAAPTPDTVVAVAPASSEPPGKPFDIVDYGNAAERVGVAANELTALVAAIDQRLPEVKRLVDETTTRAEQAIDHTTTRVLVLGLTLVAAVALAVLLVRRLSVRRG